MKNSIERGLNIINSSKLSTENNPNVKMILILKKTSVLLVDWLSLIKQGRRNNIRNMLIMKCLESSVL